MIALVNANTLKIPLADKSVHMCVTSPPYWGLRDYGLATWEGGDPGCDHRGPKTARNDGGRVNVDGFHGSARPDSDKGPIYDDTCPKCGAIRHDAGIGLEPSPEEYIANMVAVGREIWRVLRDDGTFWLNLGDSYAGSGATSQKQTEADIQYATVGNALNLAQRRIGSVDGLKPKDLCGIPWRVALALQADGWYLRSDIIWCLSGGTRVYAKTQKGVMPMTIKDMVRLDPSTVQLWNGDKWTQVLGWNESPRPDNPIELTLRSGERIGCTPGHQWPTQRGLIQADELQVGDVIQKTQLPKSVMKDYPYYIPTELGWFIGIYLAEGSKGKNGQVLQIASHIDEKERFKKLSHFASAYHGTCQMHHTSENGATINIYGKILTGIIDTYISGKDAKSKHLSMACWQRSNNFLDNILRGYLEGDGYWDKDNERWRLGFTRNYNLEADLRTLCARLGYQLRLKPSTSGDFKTFKGEIRFNRSNHFNVKDDGEIIAIGRSRARKFWDIGVADEPHLFALASGILTHNSKPNPMPESVTDRPTKAHEYVFLLTKRPRYFYDADAVREKSDDNSGWAKQRANGKNTWEYNNTPERIKATGQRIEASTFGSAGRNRRTVWTIATQPYIGSHFATFPEALVEPCVRAGTSERGCCPECGAQWERVVEHQKGIHNHSASLDQRLRNDGIQSGGIHSTTIGSKMQGFNITTGFRPTCSHDLDPVPCTVLDPFAGSGTTGVVARRLGRHFIGLDLSFDYLANQARTRLELDRLDAWNDGQGIETQDDMSDLPLFRVDSPR